MLITAQSSMFVAKRELGGKGYNLFLLERAGLPVPAWIGLGQSEFKEFTQETGIGSRLGEILANATESGDFDRAEREILAVIVDTPFPVAISERIIKARAQIGGGSIAVRSSAADEDSPGHSFAGQLSTFLFIENDEETLLSVKKCWASVYSARGLSYRKQRQLPLDRPLHVGVVLQRMIPSEKSGVLFGCDPVKQDPNIVTINAVYGVGEGLVSGLLDADTFHLDKASGGLLDTHIVEKNSKLVRKPGGNTEEVPVPAELCSVPSLNEKELKNLYEVGQKIEAFYRWPQDVEWGYEGGTCYILQSRPVTTLKKAPAGMLQIWDNSNIVESYGGITSPLTFSFARYVYREVYLQLCEVLFVPRKVIETLEHPFRNMLGLHRGRVYYNLLNWYRLLAILPGNKNNRQSMETMMGVGEALSEEIAHSCKTPAEVGSWRARLGRVIAGFRLLWVHLRAQKIVDTFLEEFRVTYGYFRNIDYARLRPDEVYQHYLGLERALLRRWHAPILNDILCMVHFGMLKKLTTKWLSGLGAEIQNDLLCGEGNMESAEPTRELMRMAKLASENPSLAKLFETSDATDLDELLRQPQYKEFMQRVETYIRNFGHRCMSELKLEQKDLHQDPTFLYVCLKNYLKSKSYDLEKMDEREQSIRRGAEEKVRAALGSIRLPIFMWTLRHARTAVRNRENLRFCRTRVFGVVRAMFYSIGNHFARLGIIDAAEEIFFLTVEEVTGALDGTLVTCDFKAVIALRKKEYAAYELDDVPPRFMTRGAVYWLNDWKADEETVAEGAVEGMLTGIGCCPGIVEGVVKVILNPTDNLELNGEVLVTMRTDPGWIPLYPSISGLLVERGGLLSHSAIVAREMGLPTVVSVPGLTKQLKTGMRVRLDGQKGTIELLDPQG